MDVGKVICSLDEIFVSGALTLLFKKGNPLLDRFNTLMRRYLEAGLLENLWTELQHGASLKSVGRLGKAASDIFRVLSFSLNAGICGTACRICLEFSGVYC